MKIVSVGYSKTEEFTDPAKWLGRISFYTGILEALAKDHKVSSIERIHYQGLLQKNGVDYYFIKIKKEVDRFPRNIHRQIKELEPDIVLVNGFIFPLQIIQLRWKLGKKTSIIVLHRSEKPFTGIKRIIQRMAGRYVDAFLFSSREFERDWKEVIDREKIHEIVQASSSFEYRDKNILPPVKKPPVFIWVGGLNENKDPLTLVSAFKQYLVFQPHAQLNVIYQSNELEEECRKLAGEITNIKWIGKVQHDQLAEWYHAADFFISSSHYEGNGIAAIEAMSCGCIPILTDIISFRRMTGPGKCGLLYRPGDPGDLSEKLIQAGKLDIETEKGKVKQQFRDELSFEAIARKINRVISVVTNG